MAGGVKDVTTIPAIFLELCKIFSDLPRRPLSNGKPLGMAITEVRAASASMADMHLWRVRRMFAETSGLACFPGTIFERLCFNRSRIGGLQCPVQ